VFLLHEKEIGSKCVATKLMPHVIAGGGDSRDGPLRAQAAAMAISQAPFD